MPVRKIGLCYRSVAGRVPMGDGRQAVAVESTLERDYALLQRFDPQVESLEEQPVRVKYRSANGSPRTYVPDFLVTLHESNRSPRLIEIKFSTDPALVSGALDERFAAASTFASARGWIFEIVTEKEIRTPRLSNATFLLPFRERPANKEICGRILSTLRPGPSSVEALAGNTDGDRGNILPDLWGMVARFEIGANLDSPLTMRSQLFLKAEHRGNDDAAPGIPSCADP